VVEYLTKKNKFHVATPKLRKIHHIAPQSRPGFLGTPCVQMYKGVDISRFDLARFRPGQIEGKFQEAYSSDVDVVTKAPR